MTETFKEMEESSKRLLEEQQRKAEKNLSEDDELSKDTFIGLADCA